MKSKYLSHPLEWYERIRVMEENLNNGYYSFLYFNISLNLIDARDSADYDKEKLLKSMLDAYKRGNERAMKMYIGQMKSMQ